MKRSLKILIFLVLSNIIPASVLFSAQPFELRRHFYYKIEKKGKLVGYAEEYLKPIKELPNLEVEFSMKTIIGEHFSEPKKIHSEKTEKYYIDLTYDRMLKAEIEYEDFKQNKYFKSKVDFKHYTISQQKSKQSASSQPELISRNVVPGYHRFLAQHLVKAKLDSQMRGELPIIWSGRGEVTPGYWRAFNDTTLTVNGIRLLCHHFLIFNENHHKVRELWTLSNSSRLIKSYEFDSGVFFELVDVLYKNYFESPFCLSAHKPQLTYLSANIYDRKNRTNKPIESERKNLKLGEVEIPLDESVVDSFATYLEPIDSDPKFDIDTLYQIGTDFLKFRYYLDEVLVTYGRWSNGHYKLNQTLNKKINTWSDDDYDTFRKSLALFSRICRTSNIPTRFVRGFYCLSVVDNLCYNWIWIEISDGKKWYPWHLELPHTEQHGAEFVRVMPVDWEYVKNFKFTQIENISIKKYRLETEKSLF